LEITCFSRQSGKTVRMIASNLSACQALRPMNNPSMFSRWISSGAFSGFTLPP